MRARNIRSESLRMSRSRIGSFGRGCSWEVGLGVFEQHDDFYFAHNALRSIPIEADSAECGRRVESLQEFRSVDAVLDAELEGGAESV